MANSISKGLASVGICAAAIAGVWITKSGACLWALIFIPAIWSRG